MPCVGLIMCTYILAPCVDRLEVDGMDVRAEPWCASQDWLFNFCMYCVSLCTSVLILLIIIFIMSS